MPSRSTSRACGSSSTAPASRSAPSAASATCSKPSPQLPRHEACMMRSIRLRLLTRLVGPLVLVNLGVASLAYLLAWAPAKLAFDDALLEAARQAAGAPLRV